MILSCTGSATVKDIIESCATVVAAEAIDVSEIILFCYFLSLFLYQASLVCFYSILEAKINSVTNKRVAN